MDNKKVIKLVVGIILLIALTVIVGYATFFGAIISAFIGKVYLICGVAALGLGIILYSWLVTFWKSKRKIVNLSALIFLVTDLLIVGGFVLKDKIIADIPVVGDGSLILADYIPFEEDTKLVTLKEESTLKLADDLPNVDGATALFPIYSAFVQAVYPRVDYSTYKNQSWRLEFDEEEEKVVELAGIEYLKCTKTNRAYERLINKKTDIIFVAGPSAAQLKMAEEAGVKMKLTPIGKEAFVFFVNSENNIKGLTIEQIQDIYSGKITNWSELGGKNEKIRAFQRPENSGSQTALQRLMKDKTITEPIKEDVASGMGGIIAKTADYKNYKNSIGYSFRYFSTEMVKNNQIKHLALNGVMPTKETIRDGSYPITNNFYAITLEGNSNPDIEKFIEWILSEQGQYIIEQTGYVEV